MDLWFLTSPQATHSFVDPGNQAYTPNHSTSSSLFSACFQPAARLRQHFEDGDVVGCVSCPSSPGPLPSQANSLHCPACATLCAAQV
jgi:hypothetical protein